MIAFGVFFCGYKRKKTVQNAPKYDRPTQITLNRFDRLNQFELLGSVQPCHGGEWWHAGARPSAGTMINF